MKHWIACLAVVVLLLTGCDTVNHSQIQVLPPRGEEPARASVPISEREAVKQVVSEIATKLHYDRPHEASLEAFRYTRECTAQLLDRLTEEEWLREGTHTEVGAYGVMKWLEIYGKHAHSHARQIVEALGKARQARSTS